MAALRHHHSRRHMDDYDDEEVGDEPMMVSHRRETLRDDTALKSIKKKQIALQFLASVYALSVIINALGLLAIQFPYSDTFVTWEFYRLAIPSLGAIFIFFIMFCVHHNISTSLYGINTLLFGAYEILCVIVVLWAFIGDIGVNDCYKVPYCPVTYGDSSSSISMGYLMWIISASLNTAVLQPLLIFIFASERSYVAMESAQITQDEASRHLKHDITQVDTISGRLASTDTYGIEMGSSPHITAIM